MSAGREALRCAGLRFFGTISASVTHELKNALAIVRELSGLLSDLGAAAERGGEIPPERVRDITGRITAQVRRADEIVKRLNSFSHGVDRIRVGVDLCEPVTGLAALCRRFAEMRRVELELDLPDASVPVETDPFLIQHVVFLPLRAALDRAAEGGRVTVSVRARDEGAEISIRGAGDGPEDPDRELRGMLRGLLGAEEANGEGGTWTLRIPPRMPEREEERHG